MRNFSVSPTLPVVPRVLVTGLLIAVLFSALLLGIRLPWRDLLVASNVWLGKPDAAAHRTVLVQIDEAFLQAELPLAMQFDRWGALLRRIQQDKPAALVIDYQFSPRRFDNLLPGAADRLEQTLLDLSATGVLVLGLAPSDPVSASGGRTLKRIETDPALKKACMKLGLDFDEVVRDVARLAGDDCPTDARLGLAAAVAEALGASVRDEGLVLTRGLSAVRTLSAAALLDQAVSNAELAGAIVVVGSGFADEDELMSSHQTTGVFLHPRMKGALVHGLNAEAVLEGRVAWNLHEGWWVAALLPAVFLSILAQRQAAALPALWVGAGVLLLSDGLAVNVYQRYPDAVTPACLWLACAITLTGRKIVQDVWLKRKIQSLLGGLLSPMVFRQVIDNPAFFLQTRRYSGATVLVLDLQGYTQDANHLPVETLYARTNELLAASTRIIHDHGGCVERFRGDGFLAYFGAPLPGRQSSVDDALNAAIQILDELKRPEFPALHTFQNRVRFGISTGDVILGLVGDQRRFDIAVTGLAANRAAHFESLAEPSSHPIVVDAPSLATSGKPWAGSALTGRHPKHPDLPLIGLSAGAGSPSDHSAA